MHERDPGSGKGAVVAVVATGALAAARETRPTASAVRELATRLEAHHGARVRPPTICPREGTR